MSIEQGAVHSGQLLKKKKQNMIRSLFIFCMIILPLLNFLVFYLYVNFNSFFTSYLIT